MHRIARLFLAVGATTLVVACSQEQKPDENATLAAILPVAQVNLKFQTVEPGKRTGEQIYQAVCKSCHESGALGSPKTGDTAAWAPRIAKGFEALIQSATNGIGQMPPKGGAADLTDAEIARAVAYLANQAGANFTPPPVE
ncbi:MAG: c-type cytochrome [Hydrogenophilus sp.]